MSELVSGVLPSIEPYLGLSNKMDFDAVLMGDIVFWNCVEPRCSHSWEGRASLLSQPCFACRRRTPKAGKSCLDVFPQVASQWSLNNKWLPSELKPYSGEIIEFVCQDCGCFFGCTLQNKTMHNSPCPHCRPPKPKPKPKSLPTGTHKVSVDYNFGVLCPEGAALWHPTKNEPLTPFDFTPRSAKTIYLIGTCGHTYEDSPDGVSRKIKRGNNYSVCSDCARSRYRDYKSANEWGIASPYTTQAQWRKAYREGKMPEDIPRTPAHTYKNDGWKSTRHFLIGDSVSSWVVGRFDIWTKKLWPYETSGKREVCDMIHTELDRLGYYDLNFLSLPGNGREIRQLLDAGFDFNYEDCLGVEKYKAKALREFLKRLFHRGELGGIMPVVNDNIDRVMLDGRLRDGSLLPEFNAIHADYNSPLTDSHRSGTEMAIINNPDAIVAVTVQSNNTRGLRMDYTAGQFPFQMIDPELLFFQPYLGIKSRAYPKGCPMETYCFIGG